MVQANQSGTAIRCGCLLKGGFPFAECTRPLRAVLARLGRSQQEIAPGGASEEWGHLLQGTGSPVREVARYCILIQGVDNPDQVSLRLAPVTQIQPL